MSKEKPIISPYTLLDNQNTIRWTAYACSVAYWGGGGRDASRQPDSRRDYTRLGDKL